MIEPDRDSQVEEKKLKLDVEASGFCLLLSFVQP